MKILLRAVIPIWILLCINPVYSQTLIRVNAGGGEFTTVAGDTFSADQAYTPGGFGYIGGQEKNFDHAVAGTDDDSLFLDLRFSDSTFSYVFDNIPEGVYLIDLHFIDPNINAIGDRVMDIYLEGEISVDDLDIYSEVGNTFTVHRERIRCFISDGQINLDFVSVVNKTLVCAIVVQQVFSSPNPIYTDVAEASGLVMAHDVDTSLCTPPLGSGSAWADYDNDGDVDLFVTNHGGANHLYENIGDMDGDNLPDFTDVAVAAGVDAPNEYSHASVFIDYDNDGDQDLYVTNFAGNILYANQLVESGSATFLDVTAIAGVADGGRAITAAWGDFDQDGYLDLYVTKHFTCMPTIQESQDHLFRNNGDGTFSDATDYLCDGSATCAQVEGLGFAPGWVDYDNDGDLDLYLVNDNIGASFYPNVLWRNDGPDTLNGGWIFTDVSDTSGTDISLNGMGLGIGDYDNDGYADFAFSNGGEAWLLNNNGDGTFSDASAFAGIQWGTSNYGIASVTWGTCFFDYNNDGWLDLYYVAGPIRDLPVSQPNAFFENNGDGTFSDMSGPSGLDDPRRARNASMVDFDEDGFVDVFVGNYGQAPRLYHNGSAAMGNTSNWLTVTVEGVTSNRDGIGTRLWLYTEDGVRQMRDITSGPTHGGGDYRAAYFGMGDHTEAILTIRWPSGEALDYGVVSANQKIHLREDAEPLPRVFRDVAEVVGLNTAHTLDPAICPMPPMGSGAAWGDYDNDNDLDLYVTNHGGANHLYRNDGDNNSDNLPDFTDIAATVGVDAVDKTSHSAIFIDYDNDGDQDLYVTHLYGNSLYKNELIESGSAVFTDVTDIAGVADGGRAITSAWADFDGDGWLDFYVAKHFICMPEVQESEDHLYKNNGDGTFTNVSSWLCDGDTSCVQINGLGFSPGWFDYDNDGDVDLYLINDNISNNFYHHVLWRNDGLDSLSGEWVFTDVTDTAQAGYSISGMGLALGDYDNDGWMDAAFSNTGPNFLIRNKGDGTFENVTNIAGVRRMFTPEGHPSVTWGTVFFDYNNDGWQDLYYVAGPIRDTGASQPNALFENNGDGTFKDISNHSGTHDEGRGRSAAIVDFDEDGFVDVFVGNYGENILLYHNESSSFGNNNASLIVTVQGTNSNRDGIGTRMFLTTADGVTQMRDINSGPTHGGGDHRAAYFGLGSHTSGDLVIHWPNGTVDSLGTLDAGRHHFIERDITVGVQPTPEKIVATYELGQNYPNPFNPSTTIFYALQKDSRVSIKIYNTLGEEVRTLVNAHQSSGKQSVVWDGKDAVGNAVASGIYIYRMKAGNFVKARKMLFTK